jgi:hypothetical protein
MFLTSAFPMTAVQIGSGLSFQVICPCNLLKIGWLCHVMAHSVNLSITFTFNYLQVAGDCLTTTKYVDAGNLAGDFAGEKISSRPIVLTVVDRFCSLNVV